MKSLNSINNLIAEKFPKLNQLYHHAYGDIWIAAKYCGFNKIPSPINGEWQHGHIIPERNIHPEFVIGSDGLSRIYKNKRYYVARQDQVEYSKSEGYADVHAVGMPIIYVKKPRVERLKRSLLVMPMHTLSDTNENINEEEYAGYIGSIAHNFSLIVCAVHKACFEKGYWIETFRKRNIEVILGAEEEDANTLEKMAYLFSMFEFVTTNEFGSQMAYAAYFGAKPSIAGPTPAWSRKDYINVTYYQNAPELLDILEEWKKNNFIKKKYPFLYVDPHHAVELKDWANFQLGESHRKSPGELKNLFGWDTLSLIKKKSMSINIKLLKKFSGVSQKVQRAVFRILFDDELKIFTHLTFSEKYELYRQAKTLPADSVSVEIGSFYGASTCFIAAGIASNSKIYCIDTWGNHAMSYFEDDKLDNNLIEKDTYEEFKQNTKKYKNKIIELRGWSTDVVKEFKKKEKHIDFLFIDGDHNYEGVKKDWNLYGALLRKKGLVAFHDTGWAEGVNRVIHEEVKKTAELISRLPNMEIYRIKG
jgi:predicted O-methyltransferase YrrM